MAAIFAIVFLLAAVTRLSLAGGLIQDWERDVCAAYIKVSGLDRSTFPVGQIWQDKVCVRDPSFYLVCKYFNGVFSGEKRLSTGKFVLSRQEPVLGEDLRPGQPMRQQQDMSELAADRPAHSSLEGVPPPVERSSAGF